MPNQPTIAFVTYFKLLIDLGYELSFIQKDFNYIFYVRHSKKDVSERYKCKCIFDIEKRMREISEGDL